MSTTREHALRWMKRAAGSRIRRKAYAVRRHGRCVLGFVEKSHTYAWPGKRHIVIEGRTWEEVTLRLIYLAGEKQKRIERVGLDVMQQEVTKQAQVTAQVAHLRRPVK